MAVKYRFDKAYDYRVRHQDSGTLVSVVSYAPGTELLIPEEHAKDADAKGVGSRLTDSGNQNGGVPPARQASHQG